MLRAFRSSFRIGSVFGIDVRVHATFLLLIALSVWSAHSNGSSIPGALVQLFVLFGIVLLHELGHSLVARHYGVRVLDITFWPLGGMARLSAMPENSKIELLIAIAGPAVNFVLATLAAPLALAAFFLGSDGPHWLQVIGPSAIMFCGVNLTLGTFNLVPAFPMDGGRVLRALIGFGTDWLTATRSAVTVGRVFAGLMILAGVVLMFAVSPQSGFMLQLVGLFIWYAGTAELWAVRMRRGDVPGFATVAAQPTQYQAESAPPSPSTPDPSGARRPSSWTPTRGALSAADVAELERFRGPLRKAGETGE